MRMRAGHHPNDRRGHLQVQQEGAAAQLLLRHRRHAAAACGAGPGVRGGAFKSELRDPCASCLRSWTRTPFTCMCPGRMSSIQPFGAVPHVALLAQIPPSRSTTRSSVCVPCMHMCSAPTTSSPLTPAYEPPAVVPPLNACDYLRLCRLRCNAVAQPPVLPPLTPYRCPPRLLPCSPICVPSVCAHAQWPNDFQSFDRPAPNMALLAQVPPPICYHAHHCVSIVSPPPYPRAVAE